MEFEEFKEKVKEDLSQKFYERGKGEMNISFCNVIKPNESYEAMTIQSDGSSIGVNVNLTQMFEAMNNGASYNEVLEKAGNTFEGGLQQMPELSLNRLSDYNLMKDTLLMEVISQEGNEELLGRVPHEKIEDMAVIYRFEVTSDDEGRGTILVTDNLLNQYGVIADQLKADALTIAPENKPAVVKSMTETMMEMIGEDVLADMGVNITPEDEKMFVATVTDKIHGAGVIAYPGFMEDASEKLGGDFFVLPSSRHEVLLVKDEGDMSLPELKNMVKEVNETQVSPEEKLTDNVYHYDSKDKVFEIGEKFEARQAEKNLDRKEPVKDKSVRRNLESKKAEIVAKPTKDAVEKASTKVKGGEAI